MSGQTRVRPRAIAIVFFGIGAYILALSVMYGVFSLVSTFLLVGLPRAVTIALLAVLPLLYGTGAFVGVLRLVGWRLSRWALLAVPVAALVLFFGLGSATPGASDEPLITLGWLIVSTVIALAGAATATFAGAAGDRPDTPD